jgi:cytoskeleton protein RodZ
MAESISSIGALLKKTRQDKELTLEEISQLTRIREKYLVAIEADNWDALPSSVQQKGFVRSYARALELDPGPLLLELRSILQEDDLEVDLEESQEPDQRSDGEVSVSAAPSLMKEIGQVLKDQRKKLGFTISNVAEQIYIPERYLEAIEAGHLEELPSTVQGKGMVKNYAEFLGLDPEPLLLSYADVLQSRLEARREGIPETPDRSPIAIWFRRFLASPTLLWAGIVVLIGTVSLWAGLLIFGGAGAGSQPTATIPGVADILLPTSSPTNTQAAPVTTPGDIEVAISPTVEELPEGEVDLATTPTPGLTGNEKIQVQLVILQRTYVRVIVDNILAFEGRLLPGSVKLFGGELSIEVITGNAAGVEVIYNQQALGVMGLFGEAVDRVFTAEGIATPTPTITLTPTPSDTPEASRTPTPTQADGAE